MKNILFKSFVILACGFLFAGCSDDDQVQPVPGPGNGPAGGASGYIFQTVKFNYDYVGSAPVLIGDQWANVEFREEIARDIINKRNLPESHDVAWECAGRDADGSQPDVANMRIWFEKVCEPVEGYYNIHVWFVRMHVEITVANQCGENTFIEETYDFWENATVLNSHPDNMIPNTSRHSVLEGEDIGYDPLNIDLQVLENGDLLQGRVGTLILPISQYNVKFFIQNQYRHGRGENFTKEECRNGEVKINERYQERVETIENIEAAQETRAKERVEAQPSTTLRKSNVKCNNAHSLSTIEQRCAEGSQDPTRFPGLVGGLLNGAGELLLGEPRASNNRDQKQSSARSDTSRQRVVKTENLNTRGAQTSKEEAALPLIGNFSGVLSGYSRGPGISSIEAREMRINVSPVRGDESNAAWLRINLPDHNTNLVFKLIKGVSSSMWESERINPMEFEGRIDPNAKVGNLSTHDQLYSFFHDSTASHYPIVRLTIAINGTIYGTIILDKGIDNDSGQRLGDLYLKFNMDHI